MQTAKARELIPGRAVVVTRSLTPNHALLVGQRGVISELGNDGTALLSIKSTAPVWIAQKALRPLTEDEMAQEQRNELEQAATVVAAAIRGHEIRREVGSMEPSRDQAAMNVARKSEASMQQSLAEMRASLSLMRATVGLGSSERSHSPHRSVRGSSPVRAAVSIPTRTTKEAMYLSELEVEPSTSMGGFMQHPDTQQEMSTLRQEMANLRQEMAMLRSSLSPPRSRSPVVQTRQQRSMRQQVQGMETSLLNQQVQSAVQSFKHSGTMEGSRLARVQCEDDAVRTAQTGFGVQRMMGASDSRQPHRARGWLQDVMTAPAEPMQSFVQSSAAPGVHGARSHARSRLLSPGAARAASSRPFRLER